MMTRVLLVAASLLVACGNQTNSAVDEKDKASNSAGAKAVNEDNQIGQLIPAAPGGEMVGGLDMPVEPMIPAKKTGPQKKEDLVSHARQALSRGDVDEAVAFTDVLILLHPADPEVVEIRGRALMAQGDVDGGMADLKACCKKGRKSCCDAR